ncbi:MAG: universal stress protein [Planctomycetota bacterium]|nr:MAG: universal stress protein [Planctomycetota bacterium]REJ86970.1 MAG: universal stress protein [Planctomycetota bacterium]REK24903.1 MAG: universal stress protein [Planctomycetota bacterium]REK48492.1 MAG: universal stress protein [Planctomycetota bacterium]
MVSFERILFPTDFSAYSAAAREYAGTLAEQFDAELHLLHVLEQHAGIDPVFAAGLAIPTASAESSAWAEEKLAEVYTAAWTEAHRVVRATAKGPPFLEILRYAEEHQIDLIVMGTHGRSGLAHVLMGSVAERVVRKSRCPVLTVRPQEHEFSMP